MDALPAFRGGRRPGGILSLVRLRHEHRAAFAYDWRTRFGLPASEIGRSMSWGEAVDLARELVKDPTSRLGGVVGGYEFTWSREWAATVDLYDLMHHIAWSQAGGRGQRPKAYPRPWREQRENERSYGNTEGRSRAEVVAYLNQLGHKIAG